MKIAYITTYNASDVRNWSGLGYHIVGAIENDSFEVRHIGSLEEKFSNLFRIKEYLYRFFCGKKYLRDREPVILKNYAKQISRELSSQKFDLVFSPGTIPIAYLESTLPIVFWTDATFAGMLGFYPNFSRLCKETIKHGNRMEEAALNRCRLAIYSSEWAAQTAIDNYRFNHAKVRVVPFGANIQLGQSLDDAKRMIETRPSDKCRLLFLGDDWERKGGDIAFEVAKRLNKSGLPTELIIVGCNPFLENKPAFVKIIGFANKSILANLKFAKSAKYETEFLYRTISESHFLILPTRADCSPVTICEANSFGVPCLATNIGGIPTLIKPNLNGMLFNKDADINEYCQYIYRLFINYAKYKELALSSFDMYKSRLNWNIAGEKVRRLLAEVVA